MACELVNFYLATARSEAPTRARGLMTACARPKRKLRSEICALISALEWSEVDIVEKHLERKHYGYLDLESPTNA
jgi:hypothetical protein